LTVTDETTTMMVTDLSEAEHFFFFTEELVSYIQETQLQKLGYILITFVQCWQSADNLCTDFNMRA
jgi:hypothetical protein